MRSNPLNISSVNSKNISQISSTSMCMRACVQTQSILRAAFITGTQMSILMITAMGIAVVCMRVIRLAANSTISKSIGAFGRIQFIPIAIRCGRPYIVGRSHRRANHRVGFCSKCLQRRCRHHAYDHNDSQKHG